jgi:hypothetical protein
MNIETRVNSIGYYIAELKEPHPIHDVWGQNWYPEIDTWCGETFGDQDYWGEDPVTGWKRMRNKYYFTDDRKLTLFVLRWS